MIPRDSVVLTGKGYRQYCDGKKGSEGVEDEDMDRTLSCVSQQSQTSLDRNALDCCQLVGTGVAAVVRPESALRLLRTEDIGQSMDVSGRLA
jgi:hypothetical protein